MLLPRKEHWRRWRVEWLSTSIQCVITWGNMQNPQQSMQGPCIIIYFFVVCSWTTQKWHAACNDHLLHQNSVCQSLPNYLWNFSTTYRFMLKFNTPHDAFHTASLRTMLSEAVWGQTHTEKVSSYSLFVFYRRASLIFNKNPFNLFILTCIMLGIRTHILQNLDTCEYVFQMLVKCFHLILVLVGWTFVWYDFAT